MVKYLPGLFGAIAGFVLLQFIGWFNSWVLEFAAFLAAYLFVAISLEAALVRYKGK